MKTVIENKTTNIKLNEEQFVKYADLLATVINKPIKEVVDLKSMRRDMNLLKKFEAAEENIELDSTDFEYVAKQVADSQWALRHQDILDFADYIESLKGE